MAYMDNPAIQKIEVLRDDAVNFTATITGYIHIDYERKVVTVILQPKVFSDGFEKLQVDEGRKVGSSETPTPEISLSDQPED